MTIPTSEGLIIPDTGESPQTIKLHVYNAIQYAEDTGVSNQHQVSGRGPTFRMTRGSFFATGAAGAISKVDSDDEADEASAAAVSPTG
jgi:hypothetical protein